ncbi:MAG: CHAT domain-containing protein/tetratricopeptide (TPR) repeat protein [Bacteroidia bacterium]|jgi:CHAT domain-containing protein/tetratricopeptide (TPR) repeat protein
MKITKLLTLPLVLLFFFVADTSAQYYKKRLDICELYYEEGRYKEAAANVDKLLKRMDRRSDEKEAIPRVLLSKAKYQEALGDYDGFKESIIKALEMRKEKGIDNIAYGVALLDASALYLIYSDIVTAESYLNAAENTLTNRASVGTGTEKGQKDLYFESQKLYIRAFINYLRGYYDDADRDLVKLLDVRDRRISTREYFFNDVTGGFEERRVGGNQLRRRKREYVQVLTLAGQIARDRGDYSKADSLFSQADQWIGQKLRKTKTDLATVRNTQEWLKLRIETGDDLKDVRKDLENNLFRAERSVTLVHKAYIAAQELLLDFYTITNYPRKGKFEDWEMETNARKYYTREKLPYAIYQRIRAKRVYYNQVKGFTRRDKQLEGAEETLTSLLTPTVRKIKKDSVEFATIPNNHLEYIKTFEQLYEIAMAQNKLDSAQSYLLELVEANKRIFGEESIPYHLSRIQEADYYLRFTNDFDKAEGIFKESFEEVLAKRLNHHSFKYIHALDEYATFLEVKGNFKEARELIEEGVELAKVNVGEDHPFYASELEKMIELELELGEYQLASENIDSVLRIYDEYYNRHSNIAGQYSKSLATSARYYATLGLFGEAKSSLNRAGRLQKKTVISSVYATDEDDQVFLLIQTEKLAQAEELVEKVIARRESVYGLKSRFLISPYNHITMIAIANGDFLKAQEFSEKAYDMAENYYGDSSFKVTESLRLRAEANRALGAYDKAERDLSKVLSINKAIFGEKHIQLASPYTELALTKLYGGKTELKEVERLVKESVVIISATLGSDNPVYAEALQTLALVNTEAGDYEEAERNLTIANDIWVRKLGTEKNTNSAEIQLLLGDVEIGKKSFEEGRIKYTEAKKLYKKIFNDKHPSYIRSVARLGRANYMLGNLKKSIKFTEEALANHEEVIDKFFRAMSEAEKSRFWNTIRGDYEFFNTLAIVASDKKKSMIGKMYDNTLATKAILLNSSIKVRNTILTSGNDSLIANYERWEGKKEQLIEELGMNNEQLKEEALDPKKTQKDIEDLERLLSAQSSLFDASSDEEAITWKNVQSVLKDDEVAVEILRFRHFTNKFTDSVVYVALVVTPKTSGAPKMLAIPNGNDLEGRFMKYYRTCIEYKIEDKFSYENYWRPIDQFVAEGSKVYLSGEGAYNQINLEAVLNDNGSYVLDNSNIALVSNTKELVKARSGKEKVSFGEKNDKITLFGNPEFYPSSAEGVRAIPQLPGTQAEVSAIDEMSTKNDIHTSMKINAAATEESVKAMRSPKVFHIATHGYFLPDEKVSSESDLAKEQSVSNPLLRSGILLTNAGPLMASDNVYAFNKQPGVLTAYEALTLRLENTELVVLSACETGRGDTKVGDGVYGLQRAFLVAGADALIMSLFKVDDEATRKLMVYFYDNWLNKKMDKRKAFIEAKRTLRKEYKDPIYWGAFIMVGSV